MANNDKESKNELEECRDCITIKNKGMRRWKPQQQIYRPGSGPLRKSVQDVEENELIIKMKQVQVAESKNSLKKNDNNNTENVNISNQTDNAGDSRKRNKKPEQQIYVPKAVVQAKAERDNVINDKGNINRAVLNSNKMSYERNNRKTEQRNGSLAHHNGSVEKLNSYSKSKRFSANRRQGLAEEDGDHHQDNRRFVRDVRQGSEPRAVSSHLNRVRDTRSVEPAGNNLPPPPEKIQAKPPSGRRHSTICLEGNKTHKPLNLENLAPRFRRKYLAENNIDPSAYPGVLDDTWDGNSITFQGSSDSHCLPYQNLPYHLENRPNYPVPSYVSHPLQQIPPTEGIPPPVSWSNTIPNTRVRGRGRLRSETNDCSYTSQILRSLTPDRIMLLSPCNSRPCTPPPFAQRNTSMENVNHEQTTSFVPDHVEELSPKLDSSPVETSPAKQTGNASRDDAEEILDWSEEVELNERLEAEALSDSMTRCSSVASLAETPQQQQKQQQQQPHKSRKHRRSKQNRHRSSSRQSKRDKSTDNQTKTNVSQEVDSNHNKQSRRNSKQSKDTKDLKELSRSREKVDSDGFKVPESRHRRRKNSFREKSNERRRRPDSRHSSLDRKRKDSYNEIENWREEIRLRCSSEKKDEKSKGQAPGIIVLPPPDRSNPPVLHYPDRSGQRQKNPAQQRTLYDPNNPNKPIIVQAANSRHGDFTQIDHNLDMNNGPVYTTDQFGNMGPAWYDPYSENFRACHCPHHLLDVKRADFELQYIIKTGSLLSNWNSSVSVLRKFFRESLEYLLIKDIKFCQVEHVENHYWKILYYNIIEIMRKSINNDPENATQYKNIILSLIDEGTEYFERLLEILEEIYKFKLDNFLGINNMPPSKGLGFVGLALISAQKIFLFLGDLARYKEKVNDTNNYGKCKQWYIKAHEINPKNGRPYNQLALLSVYARRKLDAVYYYMRSLMSSNPVQSAKESLLSLFDENRKKYEQTERKRREEKAKLHMKEKESSLSVPGSLRKEIWVHPDGGRRLHRTTPAQQEVILDSEEEDLQSLTNIEVNKRFITSYLHVHGKLITKIGMETFQQAALQMLREFRVLLQQSPVLLTSIRFMQLLGLNMYAIDSTQLKDPELELHCRSEVQERALVVSLQMFNIILERCVDLLQNHLRQQERNKDGGQPLPLCQDLQVMLPAVKVWCDWMLCHSSVWNPPPSCSDYKIGPSSDTWGRLATIMNQLEKLDYQKPVLESDPSADNDMVRLPEDATMCGFIPLMCNSQPPAYVHKNIDMESAQMSVRIDRLLFFGTEFLCGVEPPVLKLQRYDTYSEYVSVVRTSSRDSPASPPELCNEDLLVESFSEDENEESAQTSVDGAPGEIQSLLDRKVELEKRQRTQELHRQRVQAILQQSVVSLEIEVRPRYLVPDTNCFIDYLDRLQTLARTHGPQPYTLMVPLVVLGELEGLTRGGKTPAPLPRVSLDTDHMLRVATSARQALDFLHCRNPSVKCLTTRGTVLTSSTFTSEDEDRSHDLGPRNDDRILATCLSLCRNQTTVDHPTSEQQPRRIYREVVLLTEDRNLRVKALARDVPVRELPDFLQWAGLG